MLENCSARLSARERSQFEHVSHGRRNGHVLATVGSLPLVGERCSPSSALPILLIAARTPVARATRSSIFRSTIVFLLRGRETTIHSMGDGSRIRRPPTSRMQETRMYAANSIPPPLSVFGVESDEVTSIHSTQAHHHRQGVRIENVHNHGSQTLAG